MSCTAPRLTTDKKSSTISASPRVNAVFAGATNAITSKTLGTLSRHPGELDAVPDLRLAQHQS
jgi:hypothetical protein